VFHPDEFDRLVVTRASGLRHLKRSYFIGFAKSAYELYRLFKQMSITKCSDVTQHELLRPGAVCSIGNGSNKAMNIGMHRSSKQYLNPRLLKRNSQRNCSLLSNNAIIQQTSQIIPESSKSECQRGRDTEFTQVLQGEIKDVVRFVIDYSSLGFLWFYKFIQMTVASRAVAFASLPLLLPSLFFHLTPYNLDFEKKKTSWGT